LVVNTQLAGRNQLIIDQQTIFLKYIFNSHKKIHQNGGKIKLRPLLVTFIAAMHARN